ncbi:prepilin peptidase [Cetobacterium sp.]|uniref:prepilin peptidase n=1 Tax=Cetobacterium sp. TaxID=2071632 RepID=UPI0025FDFBDA|nr:prepilin peptidase [uncultured Cetobacterium sp.]
MERDLIVILEMFILVEIIIRDFKEKIILNRSNLTLLFIGLYFGILNDDLWARIIGSALYTLPFILIYTYGSDFFQKECLGLGDVKLMISIGTLLKFDNFFNVLLFINISFISALIFIVIRYFIFKNIDKEIAFGPFLIFSYVLLKYGGVYVKF